MQWGKSLATSLVSDSGDSDFFGVQINEVWLYLWGKSEKQFLC